MPTESSEFGIRLASVADAPAVAAVYRAARDAAVGHLPAEERSYEELRQIFSERLQHVECWLAEAASEPIGIVILKDDWLDALYVVPDRQGTGVGSALLALCQVRRPDGFGLWVYEANQPAREFYRSQGLLELEHSVESGLPQYRMVWPGADELAYLRGQIDRVDTDLAFLLGRRAALTRAIQAIKPVGGDAGRDPQREAEIIDRMAQFAPGLGPERVGRIVKLIISESLAAAEHSYDPDR